MSSKASKIHNVVELIEAIRLANSLFSGQVWWRGQRTSRWKLEASVFRKPSTARSEESLISRFQYKAPSRHAKVPLQNDKAGWLFLMQHYRLPTRLLDWTESPLVACFFAAEQDPAIEKHSDVIQDTDGAVFALSPYALNEIQLGRRVLQLPHDSEASIAIMRAFEGSFGPDRQIIAVRPSEVDPRLMVQLSVFTLHDTDKPLDDVESAESFLIKFDVPRGSKLGLRRELKQIGIRESSVFPDLEHLAKDVASTKFKSPSPKPNSDSYEPNLSAGGEESS